MRTLEMNLDCPPVSLNNKLLVSRGRLVPNSALKKPIEDINNLVNFKYRRHLETLMKGFCPVSEFYSLDLYICIPRSEFFTKAGPMSLSVKDGDNCIKVLKDAIWPKALKLNDGYVKRDMVFCLPFDGERTMMKVEVSIQKWEDWL